MISNLQNEKSCLTYMQYKSIHENINLTFFFTFSASLWCHHFEHWQEFLQLRGKQVQQAPVRRGWRPLEPDCHAAGSQHT